MKVSPSPCDLQACRSEVITALGRHNDAGLRDDAVVFVNRKRITLAMMQDLLTILNNDISPDVVMQLREAMREKIGCFGGNLNKVAKDLKRIKDNHSAQAHLITKTTKSAVPPCADPPSQCMLISKKNGYRCKNINPKYKLVPTSNPNATVTYYTCGHCSQDKANAWWKTEFTRVKIRS